MLAVTGRDELWPSTSDIITLDQNWHHLYSNSAGGKDLSNDAQIRVTGLMEPEIWTKMLKKMSKKLRAKFLATTPGCSMVKIGCLKDALLGVFLTTSPVECQSLQQKEDKRRKRKGKKNPKIEKSKDVGHILVQ